MIRLRLKWRKVTRLLDKTFKTQRIYLFRSTVWLNYIAKQAEFFGLWGSKLLIACYIWCKHFRMQRITRLKYIKKHLLTRHKVLIHKFRIVISLNKFNKPNLLYPSLIINNISLIQKKEFPCSLIILKQNTHKQQRENLETQAKSWHWVYTGVLQWLCADLCSWMFMDPSKICD